MLFSTVKALVQRARGTDWPIAGHENDAALVRHAVIGVFAIVVLMIGLTRTHAGYAETDFINFSVPDAERVLRGEGLLSLYHPPVYVLLLAAFHGVIGNWVTAGLMISCMSATVSLYAAFGLFRHLAGPVKGWAALFACLASTVFVEEALRLGNDMLFLALFLSSCWLAVRAPMAGATTAWVACGVLIGLAVLTRTNGIVLLGLAAAPFLSTTDFRWGVTSLLSLLAGLAIPLVAVTGLAFWTHSTVLPVNTLHGLSASYLLDGTDRNSFDAALSVAPFGDRILAEFSAQPFRFVKAYVADLRTLLSEIDTLVELPLFWLVMPGLVMLFVLEKHQRRWLWLVGAVMVASVLLNNLKEFQARYYIFLVPLIGAAIGATIEWLARTVRGERLSWWSSVLPWFLISDDSVEDGQ